MVDAAHSKCAVREGVGVRLPSRAPDDEACRGRSIPQDAPPFSGCIDQRAQCHQYFWLRSSDAHENPDSPQRQPPLLDGELPLSDNGHAGQYASQDGQEHRTLTCVAEGWRQQTRERQQGGMSRSAGRAPIHRVPELQILIPHTADTLGAWDAPDTTARGGGPRRDRQKRRALTRVTKRRDDRRAR